MMFKKEGLEQTYLTGHLGFFYMKNVDLPHSFQQLCNILKHG